MRNHNSKCHHQLDAKNIRKPTKLITSKDSKDEIDNNSLQLKQETRICKLDKQGIPFSSITGKLIVDRNTFERIKKEAVVVTDEEKRLNKKLQASNDERLKNESDIRKKELQEYDNMYKSKGQKLTQLDEEAKNKTNYLLNKAHELKQNQEVEIKHCNSLILSTKCHAIRCAQILEKENNQKSLKDEERRMIELIEQERSLASIKHNKVVETEKLKKKLQATEIVKQMKENEITRELEAGKIAEEAKIRKEAAIEAQREEVKDYKEKLIKQAAMRKEFLQINAQLRDMKKIEKELITVEIKQIQEYDRKKNEREIEYEKEMLQQKKTKELEIAKIQATQKASQDLQAIKDSLSALRTQDKVEREWRQKELEDAKQKIKMNEDLKESRRKQVEDQMTSYAYEIQREKEEFDKIIKLNIEDIERTKELDRQYKMKVDEHRKMLLEQIYEKEQKRKQERKIFFQEGIKFQEDKVARNKELRVTMQKKIEELRVHNIPTKYIHEIERQLNLKE